MPADLANLAYLILTGLLGVAFFLGCLLTEVKSLKSRNISLDTKLDQIFGKLDDLAKSAALNEAWHHPAKIREDN